MPEGTISFEVEAPVERVWAFLSDMRKVGSCVPGVQSVEIVDDKRARWNLQVKIGPLTQDIQVLTETTDQIPLNHGRFREAADNMEMHGTIDVTPAGNGSIVISTIAVPSKGPLARILDNFLSSRLKGQTEE